MDSELDYEFHKQFSLFWFVTFCGLFSAFIPVMVKLILQVITRETDLESNLRRQVCDLKAELGGISMVDEFAKYAKVQRKINKATAELSNQGQMRSTYFLKARVAVTGSLYFIMAITIAYSVWHYSGDPVVVLPSDWLAPFTPILALPAGVQGGIGITPWLLISSSVGRLVVKNFV